MLIGGPDAGKTNFLCRVWLAVFDRQGALQCSSLPDELAYLKDGATGLLEGRFAPHTSRDVLTYAVMPVTCSAAGRTLQCDLIVPDCAGEVWMNVLAHRELPGHWLDRLNADTGLLILLRVGSRHIVAPLDWVRCFQLYHSTNVPTPATENDGMPTQVLVVDWLQCMLKAYVRKWGSEKPLRIGILITAWDAAPADQQDSPPDDYLSSNFPMVSQFLEANRGSYDARVFGVTVMDGDPETDAEFKRRYLAEEVSPRGHVIWCDNGRTTKSADMTLPIAWAMRLIS